MVIYSNPHACAGNAARKWKSIEPVVRRTIGRCMLVEAGMTARTELLTHVERGETQFIAAGGDGTLNALITLLADHCSPSTLASMQIGAIGLGSSNDFHKPFHGTGMIGGIPCRIDFGRTRLHDLGIMTWRDENGSERLGYWINNASVGVTAEANCAFNHPSRVALMLKKTHTDAAIIAMAIRTILLHRDITGRYSFNGAMSIGTRVTNLGVVMNPHFSGSFSYGTPARGNGGTFFVHLCEAMTKAQTLGALSRLAHARFVGTPNTKSYQASGLCFSSERPFTVEYDGETLRTDSITFSLRPKAVQLCA